MHILIFNEYYPPDTSATAKMASLVAEELAKSHQVTVIAGRPSYDPDERYPWSLLRRDVRNGVTVERVGSTTFSRHGMRGRVSNYLSYLALAVPRALFKRADIILAMTDPPVAGIAGAFIARLSGRAFVYNIRDLYPDMAIGGEIVPANAWARRWERLHRSALRRATLVIVLGDDMRERILRKGVAPDRVAVIRDGAHLPETLAAQSHPIAQEIRSGFPFVAIHAGNLGFYGAWDTFLRAMKVLEGDDIGLVFVGEGANREGLHNRRARSANVRFLPFRPACRNSIRDGCRRRSHRDGEARSRRRRGTEQTFLNSRRGASSACGGARGMRRRSHRTREPMRPGCRSGRSRSSRRGAARDARLTLRV